MNHPLLSVPVGLLERDHEPGHECHEAECQPRRPRCETPPEPPPQLAELITEGYPPFRFEDRNFVVACDLVHEAFRDEATGPALRTVVLLSVGVSPSLLESSGHDGWESVFLVFSGGPVWFADGDVLAASELLDINMDSSMTALS